MSPQVMTVRQKQVAGRTALNADVFFLYTFNQMWMKSKVEAVAYSLST
jgi:hypothetical protein